MACEFVRVRATPRSRRLLPASADRCGLLAIRGHERTHAIRLLRALAQPIVDARQVKLQLRLAATRNGVEESDVLETQAALALTAVRHHEVIKGLISSPAPCETNRYHG